MAWEWVAPATTGVAAVTGVFFTWLSGRQGRSQVERMTRRAEEAAAQERLLLERREAYFSALRAVEINLRRRRYESEGAQAKLAEFDQTWPRGKRAELEVDAVIAVETYGSQQARQLLRNWRDGVAADDEQRLKSIRAEMVELVRHEVGTLRYGEVGDSGSE